MSRGCIVAFIRTTLVVAVASLCHATFAQNTPDPNKLLQDADRLAWLKNWTRAEPLYSDAERLFTERGDQRKATRSARPNRRRALIQGAYKISPEPTATAFWLLRSTA